MKSHIIILIDNSYSMHTYRDKIVTGLNTYIYRMKNSNFGKEIYISLILFTTKTKYIYRATNINEIGIVEEKYFYEGGNTSFYDVVCNVLLDWMNFELNENIMYIISDGSDNNSEKYGIEDLEWITQNMTVENKWKITHCDTDVSKLTTATKVVYELEDIGELFKNMLV